MSKAFKKLMKQQEEERVAEKLRDAPLHTMQPIKQTKSSNLFAGMQVDDSSDESDKDDQVNIKEDQENKIPDVKIETINPNQVNELKKAKKKAKKNKKKKQTKEESIDREDDQEDFIIQEVSPNGKESADKRTAEPLLALNIKNFNYNKELDGFFKGTRLSDKQDIGSNMNKRQRNLMKQHLKQNKPNKKYILATNEDVIQKLPDKLDLKLLRTTPQYKIFGFEATSKIASLQESYETIRNTMDPNAIQDFLMINPYYPEALYNMAEFFRLKGNYKDANYLMEKLLFFYEECFTFEFKIFDEDNCCILDQNHNSLTSLFFKALFKFMIILAKKGCYKSALEYAKLLLKLNPLDDPMGALLMIDHFALSAGRLVFLKDFCERYGEHYFDKQTSLLLYPNYSLSYALCLFKLATKDRENEAGDVSTNIEKNMINDIFEYKWENHLSSCNFWLALATLLYPQLIKAVLTTTEMHKQNPSNSKFVNSQKQTWANLFEHNLFKKQDQDLKYPFLNVTSDADINGLAKVLEIYPDRNKLIWRNNVNNVWMKAVIGNLIDCIDLDPEKFDSFAVSLCK